MATWRKAILRADVNDLCLPPGDYEKYRATDDFRPSWNAVRDQEHELVPLHPAGDQYEGPPADPRSSKRAARLTPRETRLFDPNKGETRSMRSKEDAHDYRYFPDPDLLPLEFEEARVEEIRSNLPELPDEKRERFEGLRISRVTMPAC